MTTPPTTPRPRCRPCGAATHPGATHCGEHLLQIVRWANEDEPAPVDRPDVYIPRLNGIRGVRNGGTARARRGARRPRDGELLNFDGE
jgi:hypothetical protein